MSRVFGGGPPRNIAIWGRGAGGLAGAEPAPAPARFLALGERVEWSEDLGGAVGEVDADALLAAAEGGRLPGVGDVRGDAVEAFEPLLVGVEDQAVVLGVGDGKAQVGVGLRRGEV